MRTMALAWDITRGSWVEKTKVVPCRTFISFIRSMTCPPVCESRLAVGSSASTRAGRATSARAMATRCRCPPESSLGRWRACPARPTASQQLGHPRLALPAVEATLQEQRELDVLGHREHGDEVEGLEDEADRGAGAAR